MLTLWCVFRSPLMLGGELRDNRPEDLALITNDAVLALNRNSSQNRPLLRTETQALWACKDEQGRDVLALFNLDDQKRTVSVDLTRYGFAGDYDTLDLWTGKSGAVRGGTLTASPDAHDCLLVRLSQR